MPKRARGQDTPPQAQHYKNDFQRLQSAESKLTPQQYKRFEPFMELPDTILKKLPEININRAFFVTADHAVKEIYEAMAFYVIAREAIRCEMPCVESLADALPDHSWFRCLTPRQLLEQLQVLRTTCVNNKSDRGSYRMRYCMAGILFLAANGLASHSTEVITGAAIQKAGIFAVLTGGPKMCKLIHDKIAAPRLF